MRWKHKTWSLTSFCLWTQHFCCQQLFWEQQHFGTCMFKTHLIDFRNMLSDAGAGWQNKKTLSLEFYDHAIEQIYISQQVDFGLVVVFSVKKLQPFECQTFFKKLRQSSPVRGSVITNLHLFPLVSSMGLRFSEKRVNSSLELSSETHTLCWLGFVPRYFNSTLGQSSIPQTAV